MKKSIWILSLVISGLIGDSAAVAQPKEVVPAAGTPAVGMGYREVIKLWGAPLEKKELEAKREDLWSYQTRRILFRNGKVVEIENALEDIQPGQPAGMLKKEEAAVQENSSSSTGPGTAVIEEILTEIMKGAPSAKENAPGAQRPPPPDRRLGVPPSFVEQPQLIPEDGRQHAW